MTDKDQLRNKLIDILISNNNNNYNHMQNNNNQNNNINTLNNIKRDIIDLLTKKYNYDLRQIELPIATFIENLQRVKPITESYNFKYIK